MLNRLQTRDQSATTTFMCSMMQGLKTNRKQLNIPCQLCSGHARSCWPHPPCLRSAALRPQEQHKVAMCDTMDCTSMQANG